MRTPLAILREQASALTEETKASLVGKVTNYTVAGRAGVEIKLELAVPAVNGYRYRVLSYRQPAELYPGVIEDADGRERPVADESDFIAGVEAVLASGKIARVLSAL